MPNHSIWAATTPAGTYSLLTDGTPTIEAGNAFYRYGSGTGWYADMRIIGGRYIKPAAITLPGGNLTIRAYTNTAGMPHTGPNTCTGFGTLAATKTVATSTLVDGWNDILFDTPATMPPNGGLVVITAEFSAAGNYLHSAARGSNAFLTATDGTKLAWTESDTVNGYFGAAFKIGSAYGAPSQSYQAHYGVDILTDEGTADTTPPTVTGRTPSPGATGVAVSTAPTVTFSEAVANTPTITMNRSGTNVPGTISGSGTSRTFTPTTLPLLNSTAYTVVVSGATDAASNVQVGSDTWTFTTVAAADTTPPAVTGRSPAADASGVAVTAAVTVTFSEAVLGTPTITMNRSGTNVPGTISGSGTSRTFTPSSTLLGSTVYTVVVSGATDAASNVQVGSDTWTFTTVDVTAPTVTGHTPATGATNVATNLPVTVTFSEAVANTPTITMNRSGTNVPGTVSGTGSSRTFTPTTLPLLNSTVYTVVVSGATDAASNVQVGSETWTFTTAAPSSIPFGSTIAEEIAFPGDPEPNWSIAGAGHIPTLGFARTFSNNAGSTVDFSVHGPTTSLSIYRIGGYDTGWRLLTAITNTQTTQPAATVVASSNGATSCSNWSTTASWAIPANAWSGLYVAVVRPTAVADASYVPFVVRNDARTADIVVKTSETTWGQAYNYYGTPGGGELTGACVYGIGGIGDITQRAHFASIERPIVTRQTIPQTYWMTMEMPLWRYLDKQGFNWKLIASSDLDAGLTTTTGAKVLISSGHDEYWSDGMRNNAEAFRDAGGNLIFLSANEVFWRIRFTPDRKGYWCFKDTMTGPGGHVAGTPLDPVSWTGTWKDNRWAGRKPENTITGTDFRMNGVRDETMTVVAGAYGAKPFWRHTTVATGTDLTVAGIIGMEADNAAPTLTGTATTQLAATTINIDGSYADNNGENYAGNGNLTWGIVLQLYPSGGVVAGFGTCQWQWGLDTVHDRGPQAANVAMKQATLNLLTDMSAPAANPVAGLTQPTKQAWSTYGLAGSGPAPLTSKLYVGSTEADQIYAGAVAPDRIYLGATLVWQEEDH